MHPRTCSALPAFVAGVLLICCGGCPLLPTTTDNTTADTSSQTAGGEPNAATPDNQPPTADAGSKQTVRSGELTVLDGTGSSDPDGDRLLFIWRQVSGTPSVSLEDAFSSRPRFFAPQVSDTTTLGFELIVVDGFFADSDQVEVTVEP